jgi:hypothetical protein
MSEEQQVFEALPSEDDNSQEFQATVVTNEPTEAAPEELDASSEEESGKGKDPWYKRRIDELTRDKHEARRQAERLEKILEQQRQTDMENDGSALRASNFRSGRSKVKANPNTTIYKRSLSRTRRGI